MRSKIMKGPFIGPYFLTEYKWSYLIMNTAESKTLMTSGPIWKKIILFALPLFLGISFSSSTTLQTP